MARLNKIMEHINGNIHVSTLMSWRDRGFDADFIHDITRGEGEFRATTAEELLAYLCEGSPVSRWVFQEVLTIKSIEKLDKARYKHHQKLVIAETLPGNAFYLEEVLRCALIDTRVMHAGLYNKARSELAELFNDPDSSFGVLILLYDAGDWNERGAT
ncbi:hypothetical protein AJ80_08752 [Polytolypa hystricis UAMH7299]|uniref:Uncharacterized protein n=1 Tax=Polytolypa hystricis (strain UAMH7299) TaxID=1447883 RepID=A0A2B7X2S2_POLH7|nr:hypothetical protein AJ80_08752 [Polytolypa hystricis UAMH7299]